MMLMEKDSPNKKSMKMTDFIINNKEWLTILFSFIICLSTLIATVVNFYLVNKQNKISEEQMNLQRDLSQPVFKISTKLEQDLDDGKWGTDILVISNVGHSASQPCDTEVRTFFKLTCSDGINKDSVIASVEDYFNLAYRGNTGDEEVYSAIGQGSNRVYANIYHEALRDGKDGERRKYYFLEKLIMIKIKYVDIHNESHTRYYCNHIMISEDDYNDVIRQNERYHLYFSLKDISYAALKDALSMPK